MRFRTDCELNKEDKEGAGEQSDLRDGKRGRECLPFVYFQEDRDNFDTVLAKFADHFVPRRDIIHERACFHQRVQRPGQSV